MTIRESMETTTQKKITLATIKSFVKKNRDALMIWNKSNFDGMTDCVQSTGQTGFRKAVFQDKVADYDMGIDGAWFVRGSRDRFHPYNKDGMIGYEVWNCCGSFILAIPAPNSTNTENPQH